MAKKPKTKRIDSLSHGSAKRRNAPTAELESFVSEEHRKPIIEAYERRNADLDPQLVWRGKDVVDWSDLVVEAPPIYIQEKIHPRAILKDLEKHAKREAEGSEEEPDLFGDFNGIDPELATDFYQHDVKWSNRMILGDALKVMASLAETERDGLNGQVQCIYIDPPYGIKFNSNFQWSTTSRDVKDGKADHLTREPEQVKAFRDTWADGIHSYLTYLRDRLTVARDLLTESGSIFVQIGDENVHRVRALMDEVFGEENEISQIAFRTTTGRAGAFIASASNYILWYSRNREQAKYRIPYQDKDQGESTDQVYSLLRFDDGSFTRITPEMKRGEEVVPADTKRFRADNLTSQSGGDTTQFNYQVGDLKVPGPKKGGWKTNLTGMERLDKANRLWPTSKGTLQYVRYLEDFPVIPFSNIWTDTGTGSFTDDKLYVVQTASKVIQRCILMTTDPGDLVLDPTCGSGTTAYVAEQWGRRWITIDTSRVALALARARIMGARYPWYLLADSREGQVKEGEITNLPPRDTPTQGRIRQGFVYKRVPHITLKSIANNAEIDTIWEEYQAKLEPLREEINRLRGRDGSDPDHAPFEEWTMPREPGSPWPEAAVKAWENTRKDTSEATRNKWLGKLNEALGRDYPLDTVPEAPVDPWDDEESIALHKEWWELRVARQKEIDASIAAKADTEYLYDQPYEDSSRVRVAGPFTVESLSPHRVAAVDIDDSLFDELEAAEGRRKKSAETGNETADFAEMILSNMKRSGVQQSEREDRIKFESIAGWPGRFICAEGRMKQGEDEDSPTQRAAIFIGPEYGTVVRADLVAAAQEAAEAGFDLLLGVAFNFDARAGEMDRMGALPILKVRINPDLHMPDLAETGAGNLFTIFGEPDIKVHDEGEGPDGEKMVSIEVAGVDMYKAGQIESSDADDIAVWFIDTDYNYESFFVRHVYFPGANDPYKALQTTLKAQIDKDAWETLKRTRSRPFARPESGTVAVKVINHLGDEVMKVVEA